MSAMMDIPADLTRKSLGAVLGRRFPDVTVELHEQWLREEKGSSVQPNLQSAGTQWLEDWIREVGKAISHVPVGTIAWDTLNQAPNRLEK